eukprot:GAHX01001137.1.p1 GENE.GAHX01001137.1~~GAHX01001137.1.p1  ORF type:complete len:299 (-),score=43.76 GAHX01001137.1:10-906(-)
MVDLELKIDLKSPYAINILEKLPPLSHCDIKETSIIELVLLNDNQTCTIATAICWFKNKSYNSLSNKSSGNAWIRNYFVIWGVSPSSAIHKRNFKKLQKNISFYCTLKDQSEITSVADQLIDYAKYISWGTGQTFLLALGSYNLADDLLSIYRIKENKMDMQQCFTNAYLYLDYCLFVNDNVPESICKMLCKIIFLYNKFALKSVELIIERKKLIHEEKTNHSNHVTLRTMKENVNRTIQQMLEIREELIIMLKYNAMKLGSLLCEFEEGLCLLYKHLQRYWDIEIDRIIEVNNLLMS